MNKHVYAQSIDNIYGLLQWANTLLRALYVLYCFKPKKLGNSISLIGQKSKVKLRKFNGAAQDED